MSPFRGAPPVMCSLSGGRVSGSGESASMRAREGTTALRFGTSFSAGAGAPLQSLAVSNVIAQTSLGAIVRDPYGEGRHRQLGRICREFSILAVSDRGRFESRPILERFLMQLRVF